MDKEKVMIELGKIQKLKIARVTSIGVYLHSKIYRTDDEVLLPRKQVSSEAQVGDEIEVFIYKDSEDRIIATTRKPKLIIDELAYLKVVAITKIGVFLDWGLEKDLFLPFKEQTCSVSQGKEYLVGLYVDKSDRLCATMDIYKQLISKSPYKQDDKVQGIIYNIKKDMGALVAVDKKYHGLIPKNELYGDYRCGDEVEARVIKVREDGKLDLSLRKKSYKQMKDDADMILDRLNRMGGILLLNDSSSPDIIKEQLNISKRAFKRALGKLLKEDRIRLTEKGIELSSK